MRLEGRRVVALAVVVYLLLCVREVGAQSWCGDVNCDRSRTVTDALLVLRHAVAGGVGLSCPLACDGLAFPQGHDRACGDLNCDGRVAATDAMIALRGGVGLESAYTCTATCSPNELVFQDVAVASGIDNRGMSWGSFWGDYTGDGRPDLFLTNHFRPSSLYRNNGDGTFTDVSESTVPPLPGFTSDTHGGAWADFDNDGDADLLMTVGGASGVASASELPNHFYVSTDGTLTDMGSESGLGMPLGRGRAPLWLDWNGDGLLDVVIANSNRNDGLAGTSIFEQQPDGTFADISEVVGFDPPLSSLYAQLCDMSGDATPEILIFATRYPQRVYDYSALPFENVRGSLGLPLVENVSEALVADFNGDLVFDVLAMRNDYMSTFMQTSSNEVDAFLYPWRTGSEHGLRFKTGGDLRLVFSASDPIRATRINIGASGIHPESGEVEVVASNPDHWGIEPHAPDVDRGIFIGYAPDEQVWELLISIPTDTAINRSYQIDIDATAPITDVEPLNFTLHDPGPLNTLLLSDLIGWSDATFGSGLSDSHNCHAATMGDFDNDMDVDVYAICTTRVANRPNALFVNDGDGRFLQDAWAGGAQGSPHGLGDTATTVDYDRDGFLDLLVTNGKFRPPFNDDGPVELYRNRGNSNNWLMVDLVGTLSNRDGYGALVTVTAGGVSQVRQKGCDMHKWAYNDQTVHFGLASNDVIQSIAIDWPSGLRQELFNVLANQVLTVVEP